MTEFLFDCPFGCLPNVMVLAVSLGKGRKIYVRLPLRAELLLSLLIRFLVLAGFIFLAWVVLDFRSYSSTLPVALLQMLFWWYLVSLGILPLLLCFRLWVENRKGAGIDAFLVTMWVSALLAFWIIR